MGAFLLAAVVLAQTPGLIRDLRPGLPDSRVVQVARAIDAAAIRYDQDPQLLAAIVRTESNFKSGLLSCWVVARYRRCEVTCDYGLAQVNELWIRKWGLSPQRLRYDDHYNLLVAARILKALEREFAGNEPNWYGRYHSGTPSKRFVYEQKLQPLLAFQ